MATIENTYTGDGSTMHNQEINKIFKEAKRRAWVAMQQESDVAPMIKAQMDRVTIDAMRKRGQYGQADAYSQLMNPTFGK